MTRSKCTFLCLATLVAGFVGGRMSVRERHSFTVEKWTDTVVIRQPEVMVVRSLEPRKERMAVVADTVVPGQDSVIVSIPIVQHEYHGDGYRAWVSGYAPALDSIAIERNTAVIRPARGQRRWSVGLQAGVGMTPHGVEPYIGVGVSFRLY